MHQTAETPPPPAPLPRRLPESFQTTSCWLVPEPLKLVPPTLITYGALAGVSALTLASAVPVPGGAGVVEAGLIAGLVSAGIPQDQAVAAVLIQRLFTTYLPPVWGWFTLAWMRRREYV